MNFLDFKWTHKPSKVSVFADRVEIITDPNTDLWQRTYYHFRNDNAPLLQYKSKEKFFTFAVKCDFAYSHRFDQCGIAVYLDSDNWIKASIEYENEEDKEFVLDLIKNYNSILRFTYNRIYDSKDTLTRKELYNLIKGMNNNHLPSQFWNTAIIEAKSIYKLNGEEKVIFGGKELFEERQKGKISKEEFQLKRLRPLSMIGTTGSESFKGNRYFKIISDNQVSFNFSRNKHIIFNIKLDKNNLEKFKILKELQNEKGIALTYYISLFNDISIIFEVQKENEYEPIKIDWGEPKGEEIW